MTYKLCHLVPSLGPGGAENLLLGIIRRMESDAVDHTVCFFEEDTYLWDEFEDAGATVKHIAPRIVNIPYIDPVALLRTAEFFLQKDFDVITSHVYITHHLGRLGILVGGGEKLVSVHHNVRDSYHPTIARLEKYTRGLDSVTVGVSDEVRSSLSSPKQANNWRVIHNGIDVRRFRERTEQATTDELKSQLRITDKYPIFLNVGRYSKQKSQNDIIKALARVTGFFDDPHLLLVGQRGSLESKLKSLVENMGLSDQVTITGRVDDVHPYYRVADAFVLSSIQEGFGIVLLEAMAAGLPVVSTEIPAAKEVLNDEVGIFVPSNSPKQLSLAMKRIIDNKSKFSQESFKYVSDNFEIEETAASYLDLYEELMNERYPDY